jgi:hypothetical protein
MRVNPVRQIDEVMSKEVTRKEFLATIGFGMASILGFSTILKFVFGKGAQQTSRSSGYGSSAYGGNKQA